MHALQNIRFLKIRSAVSIKKKYPVSQQQFIATGIWVPGCQFCFLTSDRLHNLKSNLGWKILHENHANTLQMVVGRKCSFSNFFLLWLKYFKFRKILTYAVYADCGLRASHFATHHHHHHHYHHYLTNLDLGHLTLSCLSLCTQK